MKTLINARLLKSSRFLRYAVNSSNKYRKFHHSSVCQQHQQNKNVILCPGQGSQYVGMLTKFERNHAIDDIVRMTNEKLPYDLFTLCKDGPKIKLDRTLFCQPAVSIATVIGYEQLKSIYQLQSGEDFQLNTVCGYSVGEIPALYISGATSYSSFLDLITARAKAMDDASNLVPSGMISMQGLTVENAMELCEDITSRKDDKTKHSLSVAIEQYPKSVSLGGSHVMLNKVMNREHALLTNSEQVKLTLLPASGAFHTTYMLPAQDEFHKIICQHKIIIDSNVQVYSNGTGKPYHPNDDIKDLLVRQLCEPVLWHDILLAVQKNHHQNDKLFNIYEVGTGKQLRAMIGRFDRKLLRVVKNIEM